MKSYSKQKTNLDSDLLKYLRTSNINSIGGYYIGKTLGKGSFGKVKLGIHKLTGQKVAIKIVDKIHAPIVAREIETWRHLIHPNIIQLYEVITSETKIYMIVEYAEEGELFDFISKYGRIDEQSVTAKRLFKQLVEAVYYCHQHNFVHRDLKLENVLLSNDFKIKLSDFGFTREFSSSKLLDTYCGSVAYAAPEMITGKQYNGPGADIWSLGVILYTMVCGTLPFDDETDEIIHQKILNLKYEIPDFISEECKDLITRILKIEPSERITIEEILNHKWMETSQEDNISSVNSSNLSLSSAVNTSYVNLNNNSENDIKSIENLHSNLNSSLKNSELSLNGTSIKSHSGSNNLMIASNSSLKSNNSLNNSISSLQGSNNSLNKPSRLSNKDHKRRMKQNLFINLSKNKEEELILDEIEKKLLDNLEWIGFNTKALLESVKNHSCNELSATWYLLLRKHKSHHYSNFIFNDESVFCPSAEPWASGSKSNKYDFQPFSAPIRSSFTTNANNRNLWATGSRKDILNEVMKKNSPRLTTITQKQILTSSSKSYNNSPTSYGTSTYNNKLIMTPIEKSIPNSPLNSNLIMKEGEGEKEKEEEEMEEGEESRKNGSGFNLINKKSQNSYTSISNRSLLTKNIMKSQLPPLINDDFKKDFIKSEQPISSRILTNNMIYSNSYSGDINMMVRNVNGSSKTYSPFRGRPKPRRSTLPSNFPNHFSLDEDGNDSSSNLISVDEDDNEEDDYSSSYTPSSIKFKTFQANETALPTSSSFNTNSPLTLTTMIGVNEEDEEDRESNISITTDSNIETNDNIKLDIPDKFIAKSTTSRSSSGYSETSGYTNDDYMNYFHQPETNQTNNKTSY
ncbi:Pkinase-domain-containing protein [Neocallimastix californiae]|uniref:Pkinase-domain-containing protein n=1 Tax=Neocallimastix californiae TaxID=1754190 RepID=A0A1Y1Z939_9FUNG|nr:Pkinase-domain-containing protein [Neocallimastix californiae]|eukprot:ORY06790.1 Pkinase-domain-containing protein [Neocallimastix californiae]